MKILFDYQIFVEQKFGGISRYFCSLVPELSKHPNVQVRILAPLHVNAYLRAGSVSNSAIGGYVYRLPKTGPIIRAASAALFRPLAAAFKPDIVHETYYAAQPTSSIRTPRVVTVYDMIHERFPKSFPANDTVAACKAAAVKRADHVFCISENTRRDLLDIHRLPEDRVSVTYLGCDEFPGNGPTIKVLVGESPYLLYVGERGGYKNFSGLVAAYAASPWLKNNFRLICFGGKSFSSHERSRFRTLGIPDSSVMQLRGPDAWLGTLYRNAALFVYPSLYEGFGIPPLEAMSVGCPVACSRTSSIPEVVGDAGEYFDPQSMESIRSAIECVLQSPQRRETLVSLGIERKKQFSWARCANETLKAYQELAQ